MEISNYQGKEREDGALKKRWTEDVEALAGMEKDIWRYLEKALPVKGFRLMVLKENKILG